eukprot:4413266-Alexandrium_andersonii.AAC.1
MVRKRPACAGGAGSLSSAGAEGDGCNGEAVEIEGEEEAPIEESKAARKRPAAADQAAKRPAAARSGPKKARRGPEWSKNLKPARSDSLLATSLKTYLNKLDTYHQSLLDSNIKAGVALCSACSGSGMAEVTHHELHSIVSNRPGKVSFACEKVGFKRKFLQDIVFNGAAEQCLFPNLEMLSQRKVQCCVHQQACRLPMFNDVFACGFSCKDFSRLSRTFNAEERGSVLADSRGTSGSTFQAMRAHIEVAQPRIIILEN